MKPLPMNSFESLRRHRAFTLVELLVVIGIIAVLVGILLPALGSARKHAATVKCLSSLRQIGLAFNLYANFYRDAFPVVRQDTPDNGTSTTNSINTYYSDMLIPFLSKTGKMNFQIGTDKQAFEEARKSVLWGCPEWQGWREGLHFNPSTAGTYINGVSRFETGYAMNWYPTYQPNSPISSTSKPPTNQTQMRWTDGGYYGKYYRRTQWTKPAERLLMVDANLWLLGFEPTSGVVQAQGAARALAGSAGQNNIDRYRHGKYPPLVGSGIGATFALRGGKVAFNVLYVDGHATTLSDIREGYKAIRMRYPG